MLTPLPGDMLPPPAGDAFSSLFDAWNAAANDIMQTAITLARRGDMQALRLILERVAPVPRGRIINIDCLPRLESVADVPRIYARLIELVSAGQITPEEAEAMSGVLAKYVEAIAAVDHEARLAVIEKSIGDAAHR